MKYTIVGAFMGGGLAAIALHKYFEASVQEAMLCSIAGFFLSVIVHALTDKANEK